MVTKGSGSHTIKLAPLVSPATVDNAIVSVPSSGAIVLATARDAIILDANKAEVGEVGTAVFGNVASQQA